MEGRVQYEGGGAFSDSFSTLWEPAILAVGTKFCALSLGVFHTEMHEIAA